MTMDARWAARLRDGPPSVHLHIYGANDMTAWKARDAYDIDNANAVG